MEEKLNRVLVSESWLNIFGEAKAAFVEPLLSDHLPLVLWPKLTKETRYKKSFKFENLWLQEDRCREIVVKSWENSHGLDIMDRIAQCGGVGEIYQRISRKEYISTSIKWRSFVVGGITKV